MFEESLLFQGAKVFICGNEIFQYNNLVIPLETASTENLDYISNPLSMKSSQRRPNYISWSLLQ